jgi:hypothetical protein
MRRTALVFSGFAVLFLMCSSFSTVRTVMNSFYPQSPSVQSDLISMQVHMPQSREKDGAYGPFFPLVVRITNESGVPIGLVLEEIRLRAGDEVFQPEPLGLVKAAFPKQKDIRVRKRISDAFLRPGEIQDGEIKEGTVYFPEKAAGKIAGRDRFQVEFSDLVFVFLKKG